MHTSCFVAHITVTYSAFTFSILRNVHSALARTWRAGREIRVHYGPMKSFPLVGRAVAAAAIVLIFRENTVRVTRNHLFHNKNGNNANNNNGMWPGKIINFRLAVDSSSPASLNKCYTPHSRNRLCSTSSHRFRVVLFCSHSDDNNNCTYDSNASSCFCNFAFYFVLGWVFPRNTYDIVYYMILFSTRARERDDRHRASTPVIGRSYWNKETNFPSEYNTVETTSCCTHYFLFRTMTVTYPSLPCYTAFTINIYS